MQPQRYSFQREKIYQTVRERMDHPTAEMVFSCLKPELPRLSLGTVYRNLHQMAEEGRLQELNGPVTRFDGVVQPHAHCTCRACGAVADVPIPYQAELDRQAEREGFSVESHALMFFGICPQCAERRHKSS